MPNRKEDCAYCI